MGFVSGWSNIPGSSLGPYLNWSSTGGDWRGKELGAPSKSAGGSISSPIAAFAESIV